MATHDPLKEITEIYNLKGLYDNYMKLGDTANMEKTKNAAQPYYQQLATNGYANVADDLSKSGYIDAKKIYDKYATSGKTQINSYLGSLGSSYGLNQAQIDALISNNPAGEVSFGGKVIGTPYSTVDGLSYWGDTGTLDNVFNDYISRSGIQKSNSFIDQYNTYFDQNRSKADEILNMISGNNDTASQNTTNKVNDLWSTITGDKANLTADYDKLKDFNYSNPFTTETGKSVLERYDLAALQGRDNQAAIGGADNGGNIDSYSAANALRQQASLRNLGEQSALAAHDRTVNSGRGILGDQSNYYSDLYNRLTGLIDTEANAASSRNQDLLQLLTQGYIDPTQQYYDNGEKTSARLFNQGETSRLNTHNIEQDTLNQAENRASTRAGTSGNVDARTLAIQYSLVDEKGNLLNPNIDLNGKIKELQQLYSTTTDPQARQNIVSMAQAYDYARQLKTKMPEYSQFASDNVDSSWMYSSTPTLANTQGVDLQKYLAELGLTGTLNTNASNLAGVKDTNATNLQMNSNNLASQEKMYQIEAYLKEIGLNNDQTSTVLNYMLGLNTNATNKDIAGINSNTQLGVAGIDANASNYAADKSYQAKTSTGNNSGTVTANQLNYDYGTGSEARETAQKEHDKLVEKYKQQGSVTEDDINNAVQAIIELSPNPETWRTYAENVWNNMRKIFLGK